MGPWIGGHSIFAVKVYWDPSYNAIIGVYGFSFLVKIHVLPCFVRIYLLTVVSVESLLGRLLSSILGIVHSLVVVWKAREARSQKLSAHWWPLLCTTEAWAFLCVPPWKTVHCLLGILEIVEPFVSVLLLFLINYLLT